MALYTDYTDEQLLALLRVSDEGAFTELYRRFSSVLYIYACKMVRDEDAAEDLVQDLFIRLWDRRENTSVMASVSAYLYTAIRYKFFDYLDRQRVRADYVRAFQDFLDQGQFLTEQLMDEKELAALIESEIACLPEKMQVIFRLSREAGLSSAEIAGHLDISEKTVKNQIGNALKTIRLRLGLVVFIYYLLHS